MQYRVNQLLYANKCFKKIWDERNLFADLSELLCVFVLYCQVIICRNQVRLCAYAKYGHEPPGLIIII